MEGHELENDGLLPKGQGHGSRHSKGDSSQVAPLTPPKPLIRQQEVAGYDGAWTELTDVIDAAISRDLLEKAEKWKRWAREPLLDSSMGSGGNLDGSYFTRMRSKFPSGLSGHEVAAFYVRSALEGKESTVTILDKRTFDALKIVRSKRWKQVLTICTVIHLALPILEVQRCLPCIGVQPSQLITNALHVGWQPTMLGSMWIECLLCFAYIYDLYQVFVSSIDFHAGDASGDDHHPDPNGDHHPYHDTNSEGKRRGRGRVALAGWEVVRACLVSVLAIGLLSNMCAHYLWHVTWHRWSRVILPFLFISRRTYLKHLVAGMVRIIPRMVPVLFLMSFVLFYYAFLAFMLYRDEEVHKPFLSGLQLFQEAMSSALTFLRIFMSIPFMLDVEQLYQDREGIELMGLSYGIIMVVFLGALIPAIANRNFLNQSRESYAWVKEQRKLALTRAFHLVNKRDGSVHRGDWVLLMKYLRPDCEETAIAALYDAAWKAEREEAISLHSQGLSKAGFFMLCSVGRGHFEKALDDRNRRFRGTWGKFRKSIHGLLLWRPKGSEYPLSRDLYTVALVVQGYQMVMEGDNPEDYYNWAYELGRWLIVYFCVQASLRMIAEGYRCYLSQWRHAFGMALNCFGVAYYLGLWPEGADWKNWYHIFQASRLLLLWDVQHRLGFSSFETTMRLEYVFPSLVQSSFVLFSVIYSYAVVAYAVYCSTPLGIYPLDTVSSHPMVQRYAVYSFVLSFESLYESLVSMADIVMLSNWPMFMDAAGDVGNVAFARLFFYSFKGLTFYFVMPVTLGFIVQNYMAANIPKMDTKASPEMSNPMPRESINGSLRSASGRLSKDDSRRSISGDLYGYSTFEVGAEKEIDVPFETPPEDDSSDDSESGAAIMVRSHRASMSQTFWGALEPTRKESQEAERIERLEKENSDMRALVENMQVELNMAHARLYDEMQSQASHASSPKWSSRKVGGGDRSGFKFSPESGSSRKRLGSANSIGMEAIVESDEEFDRFP